MRSMLSSILIFLLLLFPTYAKQDREGSVHLTPNEIARRKKEDQLLFPLYPTSITNYPVRKVPSEPRNGYVSRGRFGDLGGLPQRSPHSVPDNASASDVSSRRAREKFDLAYVRKVLQCNAGISEPALDDLYGSLSLMLMYPPTKEIVELIGVWAETKCLPPHMDWKKCHSLVKTYRNNGYIHSRFPNEALDAARLRLLRVINGSLYMDWPWSGSRISKPTALQPAHHPIVALLDLLKPGPHSLGDSVFLFGRSAPALPSMFPFLSLSEFGDVDKFAQGHNSIPFPWGTEFLKELELYEAAEKKIEKHRVRQRRRLASTSSSAPASTSAGGGYDYVFIRQLSGTLSWADKKRPPDPSSSASSSSSSSSASSSSSQDAPHRAIFFGRYQLSELVLAEQAARHPDLIEFVSHSVGRDGIICWGPGCELARYSRDQYENLSASAVVENEQMAGLLPVRFELNGPHHHHFHHHYLNHGKEGEEEEKGQEEFLGTANKTAAPATGAMLHLAAPGAYKYIIIASNSNAAGHSVSLLLAHCNCVLLMVTSPHTQFYQSHRLQPWVHYVPLSSSGADVAAKVRWLQEHDDLAQQIATNGYNFGLSYLRLEDYLCYTANVLEAFATVMQGSTALQPAKPILLQHLPWQEADQQSAKHQHG